MARLVSFRVAGAAVLCSVAFAVAAPLICMRLPPDPGLSDPGPAMTVNHFRKGDRLPLLHSACGAAGRADAERFADPAQGAVWLRFRF